MMNRKNSFHHIVGILVIAVFVALGIASTGSTPQPGGYVYFPGWLVGTWERDTDSYRLAFIPTALKNLNQGTTWELTGVAGDLYTIAKNAKLNINIISGNLVISGNDPDGNSLDGTWTKVSQQTVQQQTQQPIQQQSQPQQIHRNYSGDGGKGMTLAVLEPTGRNISAQEQWVLPLVQGSVTGDFSKYSAMTIIDRMNLDKILAEQMQSLSGNYSDDDYVRIGHLTNARLILNGSVARTGSTYMLELSVTEVESGERKASYPPKSVSLAALENLSAIKEASADLLRQLGVELTDIAQQELKNPIPITVVQGQAMLAQAPSGTPSQAAGQSQQSGQPQAAGQQQAAQNQGQTAQTQPAEVQAQLAEVQAQLALAKGIAAQKQGTEVIALSYYLQAAAAAPSMREAVSRSSILSSNISSGNIGMDVRNDIAWRRRWVERLQEAETYFANSTKENFPYYLVYDTNIKQGKINYEKETVELSFSLGFFPTDYELVKTINGVINTVVSGLKTTGRTEAWGLNWPTKNISATSPFVDKSINITVIAEIINNNGRSISRQTISIPTGYKTRDNNNYYYGGLHLKNWNGIMSFPSVDASLITDQLSIKIISIDGLTPENAARQKRINAITPKEFIQKTVKGVPTDESFFTIRDDGTLMKYNGRQSNIVIPPIIKGVFVTEIGYNAFFYTESTRFNVTIPITVNSISDYAFNNVLISDINIPYSVTHIGRLVFLNGSSINTITIGGNVYLNTISFGTYSGFFDDFYEENGKMAGTYRRSGDTWIYSP